jgi:pentatricopeptide repeat protein
VAPHLPGGHYNLGRAHFEQGRLPESAEEFRLALARKPDDFNAAYMLGTVSASLGRDEDARQALSTAVAHGRKADGEFLFQAYRALIELHARSGRRDEARHCAEEMVRRFSNRPEAREILDRL